MVRPSPPSGGHEARARVPARTHTHAHSRTHVSPPPWTPLAWVTPWAVGEVEEMQVTVVVTHGTGGGGLKKQGRSQLLREDCNAAPWDRTLNSGLIHASSCLLLKD